MINIKNDDGVTAVEYAIMILLIAVVLITVIALTGGNLETVYCKIAGSLVNEPVSCSAPSSSSSSGSGSVSSGSGSDSDSDTSEETELQKQLYAVLNKISGAERAYTGVDELNVINLASKIAQEEGYNGDVSISGLYEEDGTPINSLSEYQAYMSNYGNQLKSEYGSTIANDMLTPSNGDSQSSTLADGLSATDYTNLAKNSPQVKTGANQQFTFSPGDGSTITMNWTPGHEGYNVYTPN